MKRYFVLLAILVVPFLFGKKEESSFDQGYLLAKMDQDVLTRRDNIPMDQLVDAEDLFLEGYIQALIDMHYYELELFVFVENHHVYLYNLSKDQRISESILSFIKDLPAVKEVSIKSEDLPPQRSARESREYQWRRRVQGIWFPESTVLFSPLIANPRTPLYSVSYRFGKDFLARNMAAVSLGDVFPIFRWINIGKGGGDLQIDIAACTWSLFNMNVTDGLNNEWAELVNSDYLGAIPISYALGQWSFRLQPYHISCHLGDEYIINLLQRGQTVHRVNPSWEAVEFTASYQWTPALRLYGGPAWIFHSDQSYPMGDWYGEWGFEWKVLGKRVPYHRLHASPFIAVDVQHWEVRNWKPSVTAQIGYECSKLYGVGRKARISLEYHNGNGEGQFFKDDLKYLSLHLYWGF